MFDALTYDERRELANMLHDSARETFDVAYTFARVCLKTLETDSPTEVSVWEVRNKFVDMREEICAVIDDVIVN